MDADRLDGVGSVSPPGGPDGVHDQPMPAGAADNPAAPVQRLGATEELVVPLHVEDLAVSRRTVETALVRVATLTRSREQVIDETLSQERIEVERVPIGRYVDAAPPVREQGDLTILSVVEEVVVVERRLLLREEVHLRRVRTTRQHVETVHLREQEAVITRLPMAARADAAGPSQPHTEESP